VPSLPAADEWSQEVFKALIVTYQHVVIVPFFGALLPPSLPPTVCCVFVGGVCGALCIKSKFIKPCLAKSGRLVCVSEE